MAELREEVVCPYCGHEHEATEEYNHITPYEAERSTCEACGREFLITVTIEVSYTTTPL